MSNIEINTMLYLKIQVEKFFKYILYRKKHLNFFQIIYNMNSTNNNSFEIAAKKVFSDLYDLTKMMKT